MAFVTHQFEGFVGRDVREIPSKKFADWVTFFPEPLTLR
jgi:hypothetical protein